MTAKFPGTAISAAAVAADPPRESMSLGPLLDPLLESGLGSGELVLVIGPPGMGKSVLALSVLASVGVAATRSLYLHTPAEYGSDIEVRRLAARLGAIDCGIHSAQIVDVDSAVELLMVVGETEPGTVVVVDSLLGLAPSWSAESALRQLKTAAARSGIRLLVLSGNHQSGAACGPRSVLHVADMVVTMALDDSSTQARLLTTVKNRYAAAPKYQVLVHTNRGLEAAKGDQAAVDSRGHEVSLLGSVALPVAVIGESDGA